MRSNPSSICYVTDLLYRAPSSTNQIPSLFHSFSVADRVIAENPLKQHPVIHTPTLWIHEKRGYDTSCLPKAELSRQNNHRSTPCPLPLHLFPEHIALRPREAISWSTTDQTSKALFPYMTTKSLGELDSLRLVPELWARRSEG